MKKLFALLDRLFVRSPKFCSDCEHQKYVHGSIRCYRPQLLKTNTDVVTGRVTKERESSPCSYQREDVWPIAVLDGRCGIRGRYFKMKVVE